MRAPNLQAHIEGFIQSLQQEALEYFIAFGPKHFDYLISEFVEFQNDQQAYSACRHLPPSCADPPPENNTIVLDQIIRRERLGGLIQWYERAA